MLTWFKAQWMHTSVRVSISSNWWVYMYSVGTTYCQPTYNERWRNLKVIITVPGERHDRGEWSRSKHCVRHLYVIVHIPSEWHVEWPCSEHIGCTQVSIASNYWRVHVFSNNHALSTYIEWTIDMIYINRHGVVVEDYIYTWTHSTRGHSCAYKVCWTL